MSSRGCHETSWVPEHLLRWSSSETAAQNLAALAQAVHKIKPCPLINLGVLQNISGPNVRLENAAEKSRGEKIKIQKNSATDNFLLKENTTQTTCL